MSFLPENYQAPKTNSGYMKLQEGENRIRILSKPILGWEDWHEKKPVRYRLEDKPSSSYDPLKPIRHFWAFIVWNYGEEQIQILHLTQATVRKSIEALCRDEEWGSPYFYDLKIIKKGEMESTEYKVNPIPHKALDPNIAQAFKNKPCNLEALFEGQDPFALDYKYYTPIQIQDRASKINHMPLQEIQ